MKNSKPRISSRLTALLLALVMMVEMLPINAFASPVEDSPVQTSVSVSEPDQAETAPVKRAVKVTPPPKNY